MACDERYRMHSIYRLSDAQPDWAETDPTQPDYIKNKELASKLREILVNNKPFLDSNPDSGPLDIIAGDNIVITTKENQLIITSSTGSYILTEEDKREIAKIIFEELDFSDEALEQAVNEALQQAKENGDFKPIKGEDYWTDEDKQEIVDEVVAQMPEPEAGGMYYDKYDIDLPAQGVWNYLNFKNTRTLLDFSIGQVARSNNGRQWSVEKMQGETVPDNIIGIACSPNMIIAVAEKTNVIYMSTDGTNWSSKDLGSFRIVDGENETDGYYGVITYLDNKFIIAITEYSGDSWEYHTLPNYNIIISSDNGNTWERAKLGDPEGYDPVQITRFYYWDNVLYFQSKDNVLYSCSNLESKPELISSTITGDFVGKIDDTYYDFVNGSLYSSTDGVEWKYFGPDCASYVNNWSFAYHNDSIFLWLYSGHYWFDEENSGLYVRHKSEPWKKLLGAKDISNSARFIYTGSEFLLTNPTGDGSLLYSGTGIIWDNDVAQSLVQDGRDITSDVKDVILKDFNRLEYRYSVNNFDSFVQDAQYLEARTTGLVKGKTTLKDSNYIYVATRQWLDGWWHTGGRILCSFDGITWERAIAPAAPWFDVVYLEEEELFIAISSSSYPESTGYTPMTQIGFSKDGYNWECVFLPEEVQGHDRGGIYMATTRSSEIVIANTSGQIVLGSYDSSSHTCTWTIGPKLPDGEGCVKVTTAPNGCYYVIGNQYIGKPGSLCTYSAERNEIINTVQMPAQFTDIIWYTEEMYFYRQIAITENNEIYRSYDQPDAPWYKEGEYDLHFIHLTDYTNYFQHTDSDSGEVYIELGTHNAVFCIEGIFDIQDNKLISFNTGDLRDQYKRFLNLSEGTYLVAPGHGPTIMSHDYGEHWFSEDTKAIKQGKDNVSQGVAEALWPYLDTPINSSITQALSDLKVDDLLKRIEELEKQNSNVWGRF